MNANGERKLRVVVIDDSRTYRAVLRLLLEFDGDIEVVGEADDGAMGIATVRATRPDLVTMDVDMPRVDGLTAIRHIMAEYPVPILVVTGRPAQPTTLLFEALELGALDLMIKPSIMDAEGGVRFRATVRNLARTPVSVRRTPGTDPPAAEDPTLETEVQTGRRIAIVGIVGSTGGPRATVAALRQLGGSCPWPIAVVQHLPAGAEEGYARYLASATSLPVEVARGNLPPEGEKVWLASAAWQLVCTPDGLRAESAPRERPCPSADVLFRSMADVHGDAAVAVMLSGSNLDGIEGMRALRERGALTIVEDHTSTLQNFGPQRAISEGVAERVLSAQLIASALLSLARPQHALSTIPPTG